MGHNFGAEMVYRIALNDPSVYALSISGFAYGEDASQDSPQNMLMIFGEYDEYRHRGLDVYFIPGYRPISRVTFSL
jgi:hypothetical protein